MKNSSLLKKTALAFFLSLITITVSAQKTINSPSVGFNSNGSTLKITKIVTSDTATVLWFTITYPAGQWIRIPKDTYLQDNVGSAKYYIKKTIGIPLALQYFMPKEGVVSYQLIFPKVNAKATSIDYGEEGDNAWKIYDIALAESKSLLPNAIYTSWYNKNNSNLEVAFFNKEIVYNNKIWSYKNIVKKTNSANTTISITNGKETKQLSISGLKNNTINLTIDNKTVQLSKNQTDCKRIIQKETYKLPIFKNDSAIFSGYIKNYSPKLATKTLMLYIDNIISGEQENQIIEIQKNGYFSTKVGIYHPERVFLRSDIGNENDIYLEPGKDLFVIIGDEKTRYAGELAQLNEDLSLLNKTDLFNYEDLQKRIVDMKPNDYKTYLLDLQNTELYKLDSVRQLGTLSEKAYQIKRLDIICGYASHIIEYNWNYESANKDTKKKAEKYPDDYYNFFDQKIINDELSVISGAYNTFINRFKFLPGINPERYSYTYNYAAMFNTLKDNNITLTELDKSFEKLISSDGLSLKIDSTEKPIQDAWLKEHDDFIKIFNTKNASNYYLKLIDSAFNINKGILVDMMNAQDISGPIVTQLSPINGNNLLYALSDINNQFLKDYIKLQNNETQKQLIANKKNGGYFINQTPKVEADKILDNIISKHAGKVILVDFWATWCGPCLNGIAEIRPLKEEMKDSNVVFVYITDESSPLATYQNLVPTIKGQHYRLKNDEWRYLADKFKITGIPHQVLINKEGKVVNPALGFLDKGQIKKLLEKHL
ncbi:TlpA family protein disulfide reductase [Pedobacter alluvionis]|uniref:Thioredoxin-like protein n=1 Tax=Pedobacter alluvionis TaxID=475253 RepID=A0A497YBG3_9SPHI|nr:TlpA disulfide reductase family protein [Pedobacter alluvionis]RLJ79816.1 thioredoxin-like protein [Pedobacter alluvionis]TFB31128.1 TlpA family protein disulfide reductase [Pedobacter alluvionis]